MELMKILNETINTCKKNIDSKSAIRSIYQKICDTCSIDKLTIISYNINLNKYIKVYEYNSLNNFINIYDEKEEWDIEDYLNFNNNFKFTKEQQAFKNLLDDNNFMYIQGSINDNNIQKILEGVGFEDLTNLNADSKKELGIHLSEWNEIFFTYSIFERNNSIVKLSSDELQFISTLFAIIDMKIKEILDLIKSQQAIATRDSINVLLSQKFAMAIIDKSTDKLLYCTELFSKNFPNVKLNQLVDDVINENSEFKFKLEKTTCFNLSSNRQAYMIWVEYINEGVKLDNLTEAMLLKSFEDYYINFIKNNNFNYILCSIDIDKFKYINSMFGYSVGDNVLKKYIKRTP